MSTEGDNYWPKGSPTVLARIITAEPEPLIDFIVAVFAAEADRRNGAPTTVRLGDSMLLVSDGGGLRPPMAAFLYVYVRDVDSTFARALEGGARVVEEPRDTPYGERRATVTDAWGNWWQIAALQIAGA